MAAGKNYCVLVINWHAYTPKLPQYFHTWSSAGEMTDFSLYFHILTVKRFLCHDDSVLFLLPSWSHTADSQE